MSERILRSRTKCISDFIDKNTISNEKSKQKHKKDSNRSSKKNKRRVLFESPINVECLEKQKNTLKMISTSTPKVPSDHNIKSIHCSSSNYSLNDNSNQDENLKNSEYKNLDSTFELESSNLPLPNLPSTSIAGVNSKELQGLQYRRNTYELDETVTDVSVLMNLSQLINSSTNVVPKLNFSNIKNNKNASKAEFSNIFNDSISMISEKSCVKSTKKNIRKEAIKNSTLNSEKKRSFSRTKMPDFGKIHQQAAEKLEDISEMLERKKFRAQLLLSGQKPIDNAVHTNVSSKKVNKALPFSISTNIVSKNETKPSRLPRKINQNNQKQNVAKMKHRVHKVNSENLKEKSRNIVQGVRTNRRFDLLMEMRLGRK